eukprot:COSAG01_NODE_6142_length_3826_cov_13.629461_5_plen_247_part_00
MIRAEPVTEVPLRFLSRCAGTLNLVRPWQTQRGDPLAEQLSGVKEEEEVEAPPPRERGRPVPAVRQLDHPAVEAYARAPHKACVCVAPPHSPPPTCLSRRCNPSQPAAHTAAHRGRGGRQPRISLRVDRRGYRCQHRNHSRAPLTCAQVDLQHAGGAALLPLRAPRVATKPHLPLADGAIVQHHIAHAHVRGASRPRIGERFGVGGRVGTVLAVRPCSGRRGALTHCFSWPAQARHTAKPQSRRAA